MMNSDNMSEDRQKLEENIENSRQELEKYRNSIIPQNNESIRILSEKKSKKEEELKNCYWFQFKKKSEINNEITSLKNRMDELESLAKRKKELAKLEADLKNLVPGHVWEGFPETLNGKVVDEYIDKFKTLPNQMTSKVPAINIILIGETGAGKSSLLNTFVTAITKSQRVKDIYRTASAKGRAKAVTQKIHLEPIYIGGDGPRLPCNFYDFPGIDDADTISRKEIQRVIKGEIKIDFKIDEVPEEAVVRKNPTQADKIHCIIYVICAQSNVYDERSTKLIKMKEILKSNQSEDGVKQFVIVTGIDKIGVPNDDMKNAYRYGCVRRHCEKVSEAFDVDLLHVLPLSNYFSEGCSNEAKNAMSLLSLWRVFGSAKDFIERREPRDDNK